MITREVTESQNQILNMLNNAKPFQRFEIMMDSQGRADSYRITETSIRMVIEGKQVFQQTKEIF